MLLRSAWIAAWLMVSLNTQTSGPKAATFASGHRDGAGDTEGIAVAALAGITANPAPAARATAAKTARRRRNEPARLTIILPRAAFRARTWANPAWLVSRMMASFLLPGWLSFAGAGAPATRSQRYSSRSGRSRSSGRVGAHPAVYCAFCRRQGLDGRGRGGDLSHDNANKAHNPGGCPNRTSVAP